MMAGQVYLDKLECVLDEFFRVLRATFRFDKLDGSTSAPVERLVFERGDSAAVLLYDADTDSVVLVEQLRLPVHLREGHGWLLELVAGMVDAGRTPEEVVRSEALEEAGYRLEAVEPVATVYLSPGACTERITIFLAPVSAAQRVQPGGGLPEGGEDIRVRVLPLDECERMIADGRIRDAKTILALQYLRLLQSQRPRLREVGLPQQQTQPRPSHEGGRSCTASRS
jgi:ADP-ribose pyrophosphatase